MNEVQKKFHPLFEHERKYHDLLLAEKDPKQRVELYGEAYSKTYELWFALEPGRVSFGTSNDLIVFLGPLLKGKKVLDFGCGYGESLVHIARYAEQTVGCEITAFLVEQAHNTLQREGLGAKASVFLNPPNSQMKIEITDNQFDVVFSTDVIEHLHPDDAKNHLVEVRRILKPGGMYVINTPHRLSGPFDVSVHFVPRGSSPQGLHLLEYSYGELVERCAEAGFSAVEAYPFQYNILRRFMIRSIIPRFMMRADMHSRIEKIVAHAPYIVKRILYSMVLVFARK